MTRWLTPLVALLALGGCNDNGLQSLSGDDLLLPTDDDDDDDDAVGDDDDSGSPWDEEGDDDDTSPPDGDPPPETLSECPDGVAVSFEPEEIAVLAADTAPGVGTVTTDTAGWYHLYDIALSESGDSQWNETLYLRVPNDTVPDGRPLWANCEAEWLVVDADNYGAPPAGTRQYMGTFWLDAGANSLNLYHFCNLYRQGLCTSFHSTEHWTTCDSTSPNSGHMRGDGVCLVAAN